MYRKSRIKAFNKKKIKFFRFLFNVTICYFLRIVSKMNSFWYRQEPSKAPVPPAAAAPAAGDGIRSMQTSGIFRTFNFELYAKPNKYMMAFGVIAFSG